MASSNDPTGERNLGTGQQKHPHVGAGSGLALAALVLGAVGIACAPIFVRLSEIGPTATAFWRLALALPVVWLWTEVGRRREATPPPRLSGGRTFLGLVLAGLCFAGDLALWHLSIGFTSVANSTLLVNLAPIFVALGGRLLFGERFAYTFLVGMAVALAGAALLVGGDLGLGARQLFGDTLAVLAALFYAGYILSVSRLRSTLSTAAVMTYGGLVTCAALLPVAILSGEDLLATTLYGWAMLAGIALVSQVGGAEHDHLRPGRPAGRVLLRGVATATRGSRATRLGHPGRSPRLVSGSGRRRRAYRHSPGPARQPGQLTSRKRPVSTS